VGHHTEAFVGIDTSKLRNAVAIADSGRGGEVRYLGEFPATEAAIQKLVAKLAAKYRHLTFCYEAGPTGYGLYRLLKSLGHECLVVAPSLVPKKPGDRVKTNRRDAVSLAKLLRAGELTAVWVPDERHEAMRDLSRARQAVKKDLQGKRQQISSLMLRLGRIYPGKTTWGPAHMKWLMTQKLEHREQRIAFEVSHASTTAKMQKNERIDPSACTSHFPKRDGLNCGNGDRARSGCRQPPRQSAKCLSGRQQRARFTARRCFDRYRGS
jgi:transposase